jgi:hypothetical protein
MRRFLQSPFNRAILLMSVGNVLAFVWLAPDIRRAATATRTHDSPAWAVLLLIVSLGLLAYAALEVYLIHVLREPPPPER